MSVFIIGGIRITALVWTVAASLANESDATKRQVSRVRVTEDEGTEHLTYAESRRAA